MNFQDFISKINGTRFTSTISEIITPSDSVTITNAQYIERNGVVQLYIRWTNKTAISVGADGNITNIIVGNLVFGKNPKFATVGTSYGDEGGPAFYLLENSGRLQMGAVGGTGANRTIAAGAVFHLGMTWVAP